MLFGSLKNNCIKLVLCFGLLFVLNVVQAETVESDDAHTAPRSSESASGDLSSLYQTSLEKLQQAIEKNELNPQNFKDKVAESQDLKKIFDEHVKLVQRLTAAQKTEDQIIEELFSVQGQKVAEGEDDSKETPEEKEAREAAEKRAAKDSAGKSDALNNLEEELEKREREEELRRLEQARGDEAERSSSGDGGESGETGAPPFSPPNNSNNNDSSSPSNNSFDKLANQLSNLSQPNFSNFSNTNSSKKQEQDKPKFSLEPSKSSLEKESDWTGGKNKPSSTSLPDLSSSATSDESPSEVEFVGSPIPPKPSSSSGGFNSSPAAGGLGPAVGGNPNNMMGGVLSGGQAGQVSSNEMDLSFPFDVTGEPYDEESEYEQWPRYRVFNIPMTAGGGGVGTGFSSNSGTNDDNGGVILSDKKNNSFYRLSPSEASLKGVPGIFRSMASGFKKTRVQNICERLKGLKIGLCQRSQK